MSNKQKLGYPYRCIEQAVKCACRPLHAGLDMFYGAVRYTYSLSPIRIFNRKFDPEGGSFSHLTLHFNLTVVALDDSIANRQPQSCSFADLFRCKERGKEFGEMFFSHAATCIH